MSIVKKLESMVSSAGFGRDQILEIAKDKLRDQLKSDIKNFSRTNHNYEGDFLTGIYTIVAQPEEQKPKIYFSVLFLDNGFIKKYDENEIYLQNLIDSGIGTKEKLFLRVSKFNIEDHINSFQKNLNELAVLTFANQSDESKNYYFSIMLSVANKVNFSMISEEKETMQLGEETKPINIKVLVK